MSWYLKIGLPVLSSVLALLVAEFLVRLVMPQHTEFFDYGQFARPTRLPGQEAELIPNTSNPGYTGVSVQINSVALRDYEIAIPKPAGTYRILVIGDSVTFGYGVELDEVYLKVLEAELNESSAGRTYEVINGGLIAGSLAYYYHFLHRASAELEPDMILIGVVLNDIKGYEKINLDPDQFVPQPDPPGLYQRINGTLQRSSHLYQLVYTNLKGLLYSLGLMDVNNLLGYDFVALDPPSEELEVAWDHSFSILTETIELARERGYAVGLVVFPLELQLNEATLVEYRDKLGLQVSEHALSGDPQVRLQAFAAAHDVPMVDLMEVYREAPLDQLFLRNKSISHDPVHPSSLGHRVAGEEIYRVLRPYIENSAQSRGRLSSQGSN